MNIHSTITQAKTCEEPIRDEMSYSGFFTVFNKAEIYPIRSEFSFLNLRKIILCFTVSIMNLESSLLIEVFSLCNPAVFVVSSIFYIYLVLK